MEITGTQQIAAPRQAVWDALNDPAVLKACLPGCESAERGEDGEFRVLVAAAVGPLRARFRGTLRITEARPPESCVMVFEGQGGAVGFGKGSATVALAEQDGGTSLAYTSRAEVGGKLAQIGSRLVDSVARKMADDFFAAFRARVAPSTAPELPVEPAAAPARAAVAPAEPTTAPRDRVEVPPSTAPRAAPAAPRPEPVPGAARPHPADATLVPGWWLAVAAAIGAAATALGTLLVR